MTSQGLFTVDLDSDERESVEFDITTTGRRGTALHNRHASNNGASQSSDRRHQLMGSNGEEADTVAGDLGNGAAGLPSRSVPRSASYDTMSGRDQNPAESSDETFTIEDAVEHLGVGRFQIRVACIAGLAWTADAIEMMVLSILSPALSCAWGIPTWQQGIITSVVFVGMMIGSSFWGSISDRYGRKFALVVSGAFTLYYGLLSAISLSLVWLLVFRGLVGFGVSGGTQAVTLYSEFLPQKARAKSIVAIELFWVAGSAFSAIMAYFVMPVMGWRWLLVYSAVPLVLFCVACLWLPESMRFNLSRGHVNDAMKTLKDAAKANKTTLPKGRLVPPPKQDSRGKISDLFIPELRRTTILLWFIWFANTFCYYGIVLLTTELLGIQSDDVCVALKSGHLPTVTCALDCIPLKPSNYLEILWTAAAEFPGLLLTFFIIDIIGRKFSAGGQFILFAVSTGLVAICKGRMFMIVWLFAARCFISGGFQVTFVYTPEIYPTSCRALGLGVCSSFARIGAVVTPFVAQVLLQSSIYSALGIYAGVAALAGVCWLLLPIETKGKTLQESHQHTPTS